MLTEWQARGDPDSPATPLTLPRRDWLGDSFTSTRLRLGAPLVLCARRQGPAWPACLPHHSQQPARSAALGGP